MPMDPDEMEAMLRRAALKRPVEVRSVPRFTQPAVPQRGFHLNDLPCAILAMIFSVDQFITRGLNIYEEPKSKEEGLKAFAFVNDFAALRLVNVSCSRRFKVSLCSHAVRRAIHLKPKSPLKTAYGASLIAFIVMNQAMRCQTEQGSMGFAFLKTFRIQELLDGQDTMSKEQKYKLKEMLKNVNDHSNSVPTWPPNQRVLS